MPSIKYESRKPTEEFRKICNEATSFNENNDCAVRAVTIATGVPYEKVRNVMAAFGRKARRGTRLGITERTLAALGFKMEQVPRRSFIDRYPGVHRTALRSVTTHHPERFNDVWADGNTYLMRTSGHILAIVNGANHDWTKGKAKRATAIYKVEKAQ